MKLKHYIAMDMHVSHTMLGAQKRGGRVVRGLDLPTEARALINAVKEISGSRGVVIEESTMADWGYRLLRPLANEVVVCDPRPNKLASEGDKDDSVDPGKPAELYIDGHSTHAEGKRRVRTPRACAWGSGRQRAFTTGLPVAKNDAA